MQHTGLKCQNMFPTIFQTEGIHNSTQWFGVSDLTEERILANATKFKREYDFRIRAVNIYASVVSEFDMMMQRYLHLREEESTSL